MSSPVVDRWEFAARLAAMPALSTVVVPDDWEVDTASEELAQTLRRLCEAAVQEVEISSARDVERVIVDLSNDWLVLRGFSRLSYDEWAKLDRSRSRLMGRGRGIVFVLHVAEQYSLARGAPNLASWLATATHRITSSDALDDRVREARLIALRQSHGISDDDAVNLVVEGDARGLDPDLAEWMLLLGRANLLGMRNG